MMDPVLQRTVLPMLRERKKMSDYYKSKRAQKEEDALIAMTIKAEQAKARQIRRAKARQLEREWWPRRRAEAQRKFDEGLMFLTQQAEQERALDQAMLDPDYDRLFRKRSHNVADLPATEILEQETQPENFIGPNETW